MKKGFTLVELLGVLVVLSVIGLITVPIVTNVLNANAKKVDEEQKQLIENAAKTYMNAHAFDSNFNLTVQTLVDEGYLDSSVDTNFTIWVTQTGSKYNITVTKSG